MKKLQTVRGFNDLLEADFLKQQYIIEQAKQVALNYNFQQVATPIVEFTKVFDRSLGETSDVVSKEMFSFADRNDESLTLRPEFTASIVRAFLEHGLQQNLPFKAFSHGPVFRYDRPQKGRYRQFHQLNFENIGAAKPIHDAETLQLACQLLDKLNLLNEVTLELNSLGCSESRKNYQHILFEYLNDFKAELSHESQQRLLKNPMRVLDSKSEQDQKIVAHAPKISDSLTAEAKDYFAELLTYLDNLGIKYSLNEKLVRGLDYYTHTAFEFTTTKLGAQATILAGGRYDGLVELMGGKPTPAIGFAAGIERLALLIEPNIQKIQPIAVINIGDENAAYSLQIASELRKNNFKTIFYDSGKMQKNMNKALNEDAAYIIFIGDEEREKNIIKIKNLKTRNEEIIPINNLLDYFG